ncbi:MAG: hypothetical protein OIF57_04850 [Marinobacterium sp.]|nr:hypothetical protein [Marinobacterium sp.]
MSMRYGTFAMETLINDLLRAGASKQRLEAKVTGGGQVLGRHSMVGKNNIRFIRAFLQTEEVPVLSEDTGGGQPRRVIYIAREGRLLVRKLPVASMNRLMRMEEGYQESLNNSMDAADAELF